MYTYRDSGDQGDGRKEKTERTPGIRRGEEEIHHDADPNGLGSSGGHGYTGWTVPIGPSGENRAWFDSFRQADPTRGGIASRLLESKLQQLSEVQGRLSIVNQRKIEYESKIVQLELEIKEIQAIAAEILQIDQGQE